MLHEAIERLYHRRAISFFFIFILIASPGSPLPSFFTATVQQELLAGGMKASKQDEKQLLSLCRNILNLFIFAFYSSQFRPFFFFVVVVEF